MAYLVLARKWRPQTFEEVVGQGHVTQTLRNALASDRLAHALLFSGPRGVGKTSVARILAKALNCDEGPTPTPCNRCGACREITAGTAVDVLEVDGASNRGIDEVRQLRENIRFRPARGRFRVCILDEVHMLTKEAFNALLKTLEEPPPHVYFVFATTEPRRIPPTIHSRCQHYEFRRLPADVLAEHLRRIVEAEGLGLDAPSLALLAREAEGSVRDALSLLDQVSAYGARTREEVSEALGVVDTVLLRDLAEAILARDVSRVLALVDRSYDFGGDLQRLLSDLVRTFRNLLVIRLLGAGGAGEAVDLLAAEREDLERLAALHAPETLQQALEALLAGEEAVHRSATPRLALEALLLRVCQMGAVASVDDVLRRLDALIAGGGPSDPPAPGGTLREAPAPGYGAGGGRGTESTPRGAPAPPPPGGKADRPLTAEAWAAFLGRIQREGTCPSLAPILAECAEVDPATGGVRVTCNHPIHQDMLQDAENRAILARLAREHFGRDVPIRVDGSAAPGGRKPAAATRQQALKEAPLVREALRVFNGRIDDVQPLGGGKPRP
ncbi:DNA polymerase III subunit gamma/tau [Dissulfurirhabdus thermomarina]|nr:DNA polymerase III subunit gamma/tau [Dissulfurirhabdus thermomarina]